MRLRPLLLLLLAACGPRPEPVPTVDLEGDWVGTWTASMSDGIQGGGLSITIAGGEITGSCTNTARSHPCEVIGTVDSVGRAMLTYTWPAVATFTASCAAVLRVKHAVGDCELLAGKDRIGTLTFDLEPTNFAHSATPP